MNNLEMLTLLKELIQRSYDDYSKERTDEYSSGVLHGLAMALGSVQGMISALSAEGGK